jgi:ABC-type transport system involved in cytochrome bd biosynthesis fused ATPase/permease subunit
LNENYTAYFGSIKQLIIVAISQRKELTLTEFIETFSHWLTVSSSVHQQETLAQQIESMLINMGYFSTHPSTILRVLNKKITSVLGYYSKFLPEIIRVMSHRFALPVLIVQM